MTSYRFELFNPGIAGGWIQITGWLPYQFLDGWVAYLKEKYRPKGLLGLITFGTWGPTVRIVINLASGEYVAYQNKISEFPLPTQMVPVAPPPGSSGAGP